ncbi:MAG: VWA domain-containing protein [bacterium]|nr:VWA domain-containing protein [bacterium]
MNAIANVKNVKDVVVVVLLFSVVGVVQAKTIAPPKPSEESARHVDLVICLDTSGSMSGLIQSAKQKLWAVVNELATVKPKPVLRVALYHYGNSGLTAENGWVKQLCPLTTDLDKVYE